MTNKATTLREFLKAFGITNRGDLTRWLQAQAKPNQSNYQAMVKAWGEPIADKVMRSLEISDCHSDIRAE
jgi:hypothetical protein